MDTPLVETVGLTKHFKTPHGLLHAIDKVDLKIGPCRTLGVVGESGCGKSTLGRTVLGLQEQRCRYYKLITKNLIVFRHIN